MTFSFIKQEIQLAGTAPPTNKTNSITNWACKSQGHTLLVMFLISLAISPQLLHTTASAYFYLLSSSTKYGPLWSQSSWWPQLWIELNSVNDKMIKYRSIGVPTNKHVPNTIVIAEKISAVRGWNSAFCYNVVFLSSGKCKSFNPSSTSYLFYPI